MERFAAHCFFACGHIERHADPQIAHDRMEIHYELDHAEQVARIVTALGGVLKGRK